MRLWELPFNNGLVEELVAPQNMALIYGALRRNDANGVHFTTTSACNVNRPGSLGVLPPLISVQGVL